MDRLEPDPEDAALHELRKRAKRARYAAELIDPLLHGEASRFTARLADLQDTLGELQDCVVADQWLLSARTTRSHLGKCSRPAPCTPWNSVNVPRRAAVGATLGTRHVVRSFGPGCIDPVVEQSARQFRRKWNSQPKEDSLPSTKSAAYIIGTSTAHSDLSCFLPGRTSTVKCHGMFIQVGNVSAFP